MSPVHLADRAAGGHDRVDLFADELRRDSAYRSRRVRPAILDRDGAVCPSGAVGKSAM